MLHVSWDVALYIIVGIVTGITCTKKIHLVCGDGSISDVYILYSEEFNNIIISPTNIVISNQDMYDSWWQQCYCKNGCGDLRFFNSNGIPTFSIDLFMMSTLWYLSYNLAYNVYCDQLKQTSKAFL